MPKKTKTNQSVEVAEAPVIEPINDVPQPVQLTKEEYLKARATIKQYRENQKNKPKRKCSEKQLEALAKGREANRRLKKKEETSKSTD